jgi:FdhE protein
MSINKNLAAPEEIAARGGAETPFMHLPERSVFAQRATRLRLVAQGSAMADYLEFIARVADAQQAVLDNMPAVVLPAPDAIAQCREHGLPPVNAQTHHRDRAWCDGLRRMLRALAQTAEGKVRDTIVMLEGSRDELYEAQASKLLHGITFGLDIATAPLIGAGLQAYWVHLVTALGAASFGRTDVPNLCPCCGSHPTASIVRAGTAESGHRYLHCSLCATQWHMVRIKCTHCDSTKGIRYQSIDDGQPSDRHAVKAECCDECGSYLKIMYMDRNHQIDPVADDLATIALDLLVAETGKASSGVNFMLIHGDSGAG